MGCPWSLDDGDIAIAGDAAGITMDGDAGDIAMDGEDAAIAMDGASIRPGPASDKGDAPRSKL